jgi:glutamate synthase (NADPH/NADH) small chain
MGKPGAFMEYGREIPADLAAVERILHWKEFHRPFSEEKLRQQGARCMDCGIPFCHTGQFMHGMTSGCPIHNLIPEWNDLIYRDLWKEALKRLLFTNNFPEFTGRVCPAPCEGSCTAGLHGDAVTIKNIELAIIEKGFRQGWIKPHRPAFQTGKRVAVIGSGPAGLACADSLNQAGHAVIVYERAERPGGLLMYGIPNMKLEKHVVNRRIDLMQAEGIKFITQTEVGVDYPADQLLAEHDAVVLCGGATRPRDLQVEGRELKGIHFAMEFLRGNTRNLIGGSLLDEEPITISARGKNVVVIGGGDTGTDCVATSLRHGCQSVTQLEILPQSPAERPAGNPWPEWPRINRLDYGQEEAATIFGEDPRMFNMLTKKVVGDAEGQITELLAVRVAWKPDAQGRMQPEEIPGSEIILRADLILLAMGFLGPEDQLLNQLGINRETDTRIKTPIGHYATNLTGVYAAGDMRRGQSLVVWAIQEGRAAAQEVDQYLMKEA